MVDAGTVNLAGETLLRLCADPKADHSDRLAGLDANGWDALLAAVEGRRLAPLVLRAINRAATDLSIPKAVRRALVDEAHWHRLHALRQSAAMAHLQVALAREGFAPLLLKGVALAYRAYPEPYLRPMRDIDVLLAGAAAQQAQDKLLASPRYRIHPDLRGTQRSSPEHLLPIQDAVVEATIEIHHRVGDPDSFPAGPRLTRVLAADQMRLSIGSSQFCVPRPEANLLHLLASAAIKDRLGGGPIILADLHYLASEGLDWAWVWHEARHLGLQRSLALFACIARCHGASWVPSLLLDPIRKAELHMSAATREILAPAEVAVRRKIVDRVARASGSRGFSLMGAARLAVSPDPIQLGRALGVAPESKLRWLGYPLWLAHRFFEYVGARRATRNSSEVRLLRGWLINDEADR